MKTNAEFKKRVGVKLALFFIALVLLTMYSKSISNYVLDTYNDKLELVANRTTNNVNWIRY
ncbi:hypothetical protein [Winogradskyella vincentii]|uniref:Methyl-accepting chemotaxis protein n=1 Tax=Winogradskyella vincentii TaxID=2877122 RepID=A0ABS7Y353_9FLAO|nr:hypothetical protein [Winogradskyella vincentii]MCA0154351.1 hypothetical protein [Winogradskyella vincentii]